MGLDFVATRRDEVGPRKLRFCGVSKIKFIVTLVDRERSALLRSQCPLGVISGHNGPFASCPLCPP